MALDLDGTLLSSNLTLPAENVKAISETRNRGIVVAIATGRMTKAAVEATSALGSDLPLAIYNGAMVRLGAEGPVVLKRPIPADDGARIVRFMWDWGIVFQAHSDGELWVPRASRATADYEARYGVTARVLNDIDGFIQLEAMKYLVIEPANRVEAIQERLREVAGAGLRIMRSHPDMLEIVSANASKGRALRHLAEYYGISMAETMAVGDSENDIDMLREAGIAVAMGNACDDIKGIADFVTGANDDHGVAMALQQFGLCGA